MYTDWSVVFGEQPSAAKWNQLGSNDAYFYSIARKNGNGFNLIDSNENEIITGVQTTSAVNELTVTNAATGNAPSIAATGGDTNINLALATKGSGVLTVNGNTIQDGAWTSFSPTWANNSIGNGTESAKYRIIGKSVRVEVHQKAGSTTAWASGQTLAPPVAADSKYSSFRASVGHGMASDIGAVIYPLEVYFDEDNSVFKFVYGNATTAWTTNFPFTETTGDFLSFFIEYEAA